MVQISYNKSEKIIDIASDLYMAKLYLSVAKIGIDDILRHQFVWEAPHNPVRKMLVLHNKRKKYCPSSNYLKLVFESYRECQPVFHKKICGVSGHSLEVLHIGKGISSEKISVR